jgi:hypothetical protein
MDFMGLGMMVFRLNAAFSQKLTPRRKKIKVGADGTARRMIRTRERPCP